MLILLFFCVFSHIELYKRAVLPSTPASLYDPNIFVLSPDTFGSTLQTGTWLVEFYSPKCGHCKRFRPIINRVARETLPWGADKEFKMGILDCIMYMDFCESTGINLFPTIYLYTINGTKREEFLGDLEYVPFARFIIDNVKTIVPAKKQNLTVVDSRALIGNFSKRLVPGADGQVHTVTSLTELIGPWLLVYNPQISVKELATLLYGKVSVGIIKETTGLGIMDTHAYLVYSMGRHILYQGPRDFRRIIEFVKSTAVANIHLVTEEEIKDQIIQFDVVVVFRFNNSGSTEIYLEAISNFVYPSHMSFVATKSKTEILTIYRKSMEPESFSFGEHFGHNIDSILDFLHERRYPLVPEITEYTADDLMLQDLQSSSTNTRRIVVMAALDPYTTASERIILKNTAQHFKAVEHTQRTQREGNTTRKSGICVVQITWLNAVKWTEYLHRVFNVNLSDCPKLFFIVPGSPQKYYTLNDNAFTQEAITKSTKDIWDQMSGNTGVLIAQEIPKGEKTEKSFLLYYVLVLIGVIYGMWWFRRKNGYHKVE